MLFRNLAKPRLNQILATVWRRLLSSKAETAAGFDTPPARKGTNMNSHEQAERRPEGKEGAGAHQTGLLV